MNASIKALVVPVLLVLCPLARADHAMLTNGRVLYNVTVPAGADTVNQLVRVRLNPYSFEYDPSNNIVIPLRGYSVTRRLADYITTTTVVGRKEAVALVKARNWNNYVPAPRPLLITPTPAPKLTPTPVSYTPKEAPPALKVVSDKIPLHQRLDAQMEQFMREQGDMARDSVTSVVQGRITPQQSMQYKLSLLERQKNILERYYPQDEESVKTAINYWAKQVERVRQTGRFDLEDL